MLQRRETVQENRYKQDKFWSRVHKTDLVQEHMDSACWLWTGASNQRYGHMRPEPMGILDWPTTLIYAHHASWLFAYGPIPEDLHILHRCNVSLCVHPEHLYAGTRSDTLMASYRGGLRDQRALTDREAKEIRRLAACGAKRKSLAAKFGRSIPYVNIIVAGKAKSGSLFIMRQARRAKLKQLAASGATLTSLARALEVHPLTITKDLHFLGLYEAWLAARRPTRDKATA